MSTSNSISFNQIDGKDNADGCVLSSDCKKGKSSFSSSNKCSYCRNSQKLSFRESSVFDTSLKNFSTGQLLKFGFDNLNNVLRALEELKIKQYALKDYLKLENGTELEVKVESLFENLSHVSSEFEKIRNEFMPATYSNVGIEVFCLFFNKKPFGSIVVFFKEDDDDDFDDQASYLSSTTTTSMGYWDPEPNLHFFELYQEALKNVSNIKPPKANRTNITLCDSYEDFLAKVHCLRQAFSHIFLNIDARNRYIKIGEDILKVLLNHRMRVTICVRFILL